MNGSSAGASRLFRLLNECLIGVLGVLLVLLALTHRFASPSRPVTWILVGMFLIYWGARAGLRPKARKGGPRAGMFDRLRGGSFVLSGMLILSVPGMPAESAPLLLALAGGILGVRGLLGAALFARPVRPIDRQPGDP